MKIAAGVLGTAVLCVWIFAGSGFLNQASLENLRRVDRATGAASPTNPSKDIAAPKHVAVDAPIRKERNAEAGARYGKLPLSFEKNQGQTDERVKFLSRGRGYSLFLTEHEAVIALKKALPAGDAAKRSANSELPPTVTTRALNGDAIRMELAGASGTSTPEALDELPGKTNYFIGNDPAKWRANVATYAKVKYRDVYPGVDLVYYGDQEQLEYDFVVAPGADPNAIRLQIRGNGKLRVDEHGDLAIGPANSGVKFEKPVLYQDAVGGRRAVGGRYVLTSATTVGFRVESYDREKPLVIDPVLSYSTYLGGSAYDQANGVAVDSAGEAYIVGYTSSTNFPTSSALNPTLTGSQDVFISKLNSNGTGIVYSTYLGGASSYSMGNAVAIDSTGDAYVTGYTEASDFPTANPLQGTLAGPQNCFVTEVNPTGSGLIFSTFLGGSQFDLGYGVATDASNNVYLTGNTSSPNFPTANALQANLAGTSNAFATEIGTGGSPILYSTYLGGNGVDFGYGIAVDSQQNAYIAGFTTSSNFPVINALQASQPGGGDAFVTKISAQGSSLVYSTYLGGANYDSAQAIAVDAAGNAYVTGNTSSTNFPVLNAIQPALGNAVSAAFVSEIDVNGSGLVYSSYLGGSGLSIGTGEPGAPNGPVEGTLGYGIAVDSNGNAFVTGSTSATNFPTVNPVQSTQTGQQSAFVTVIATKGASLLYSTYLGGVSYSSGNGVAIDGLDNAYVAGYTSSVDFPTLNPIQSVYGGDTDAFIAKISPLNPDFTGTISPPTQSVASGGSLEYGVTVLPLNGFTGAVTLSASDLPAGATYTFNPATVTGGSGTSLLTVTTAASTPTGSYTPIVTGTSPGLSHNLEIFLAVNEAAVDFAGTINPVSQTVAAGSSAIFNITVIPVNGFSSPVNLSLTDLPAGASFSFSPATVAGGWRKLGSDD